MEDYFYFKKQRIGFLDQGNGKEIVYCGFSKVLIKNILIIFGCN